MIVCLCVHGWDVWEGEKLLVLEIEYLPAVDAQRNRVVAHRCIWGIGF